MAVRFEAPIYTYETILVKAGIYLKIEEEIPLEEAEFESEEMIREVLSKPSEEKISDKDLKELQKELGNAVANENYELAAKIRDEISKRS